MSRGGSIAMTTEHGASEAEHRSADRALGRRIEVAATRALKRFPSESKWERHPSPDVRLFLRETRKLLEEGKGASGWSESTMTTYAMRVSWAVAGVNFGRILGGGEGESCTARCERERRECIETECGPETSWPCGCCVPCNVTWAACLADCILD
jgi:hypothetical protein